MTANQNGLPMHEVTLEIDGRIIGPGHPPYLIAEIGINHGGDAAVAKDLLAAAVEAGAQAAKFQAYSAAALLTRHSAYFDIIERCQLSADTFEALMASARNIGLTMFASVFDEESAGMMEALGAPAYKIASGDLTHHPLLRHVAGFGKPMIVSTGGATMGEIEAALGAIRDAGPTTPVALMHCVSNYPTEAGDTNLACLDTMARQFGVPVGFSDHTIGSTAAITAVALGANMVEKHFTLDRNAEGPDHKLSVEPADLHALAEDLKTTWRHIGSPAKAPVESPELISHIRRGVTANQTIAEGARIERAMLGVKRPATGIAPEHLPKLVGRTADREIEADSPITWDMLR